MPQLTRGRSPNLRTLARVLGERARLTLWLLMGAAAFGAAAVPAQALGLPPLPLVAPDEEADAAEAGDESGDENEAAEDSGECTIEDEEDVQLCAEIAAYHRPCKAHCTGPCQQRQMQGCDIAESAK